MYHTISPANIRFMQDSIHHRFRNGRSVNETLESIIKGQMKASDFPTITVVEKDGKYYSQDNRRLYVFRALHHKRMLDRVQVRIGHIFNSLRFTTTNDGVSVVMRRGFTYPHAISTTIASPFISTTNNISSSNLTNLYSKSSLPSFSLFSAMSHQRLPEIRSTPGVAIPQQQSQSAMHDQSDCLMQQRTAVHGVIKYDFGTFKFGNKVPNSKIFNVSRSHSTKPGYCGLRLAQLAGKHSQKERECPPGSIRFSVAKRHRSNNIIKRTSGKNTRKKSISFVVSERSHPYQLRNKRRRYPLRVRRAPIRYQA